MQLANLPLAVELARLGGEVQHVRHPPREVLRLPDAVPRRVGVGVDAALVVLEQQASQRPVEQQHVGHREVHALCAGGRNRVGRVADEGRPAAAQLAHHEAAEAQHIALEDGALVQRGARHTALQGVPNLGIAHGVRVGLGVALEVHALHGVADEREAARRIRIDELVRARRGLAENTEPGEGVLAKVAGGHRTGDRGAHDAARAEGQNYILIDGGLVQNDPGLPVFDLDVLSSDGFISSDVSEVIDLYNRVAAHPEASKDWSGVLGDAATIVRRWGAPEDIELINELEDKRKQAES